MKLLIEAFGYFILFAFISFICVEFYVMNTTTSYARETHSNILDMIEDSDYDSAVINEAKTIANNKGFEVTITDKSKTSSEGYILKCFHVALSYENKIALLGIRQNSVIEGYAKE